LESSTGAKAFGVVLDQNTQQHGADTADSTPSAATAGMKTEHTPGPAESESIASAAAATADAYARSLNTTPSGKKSGATVRRLLPTSSRKTRHQKAAEEKAAVSAMPARVLDVDPFSGVVDVSLESEVIESAGKRSPMTSGKAIVSKVLLVKDEYVVLSLPRGKGRTSIGFCLLPAVDTQLRMRLRCGIALPCVTIKTSPMSSRYLVYVDWSQVGPALMSKKRVNLAIAISTKEVSPDVTPDNVKVGDKVSGKVSASFPMHANVAIAPGVVGRIHVTRYGTLKSPAKQALGLITGKHVSDLLPAEGDRVRKLTVMSVTDPRGDDSGSKRNAIVLELARNTHGSAVVDGEDVANFVVGMTRVGFVKHIKLDDISGRLNGVWIALTPTVAGYCSRVDALSSEGADVSKLEAGVPVACMITTKASAGDTRVNVTVSSNGVGDCGFYGIISSVRAGDGLRVELPWHARAKNAKDKWWGFVALCDVSDDFDIAVKVMNTAKPGDIVRVRAVTSADKDSVQLSMRGSVVEGGESTAIVDRLFVDSVGINTVGSSVRGFIRSVGKSGGFLSIGRHVVARVLLSDLADEFVKEPSATFPVGMLVSGKIIAIEDSDPSKVQMVLRTRERKVLKRGDNVSSTPPLLTEGSVVVGTVTRVERFGALIEVAVGISALLHKSEADQDRIIANPFAEWNVGQALTAVMLEAKEAGKHRVGTKRCYFEAAGLDADMVDEVLESNARKKARTVVVEGRKTSSIVLEHDDSDDDDDDVEIGSNDGNDEVLHKHERGGDKSSGTSDEGSDRDEMDALPISRGFLFDDVSSVPAVIDASDEGSASDGMDGMDDVRNEIGVTKKSSREKREKRRAKEAAEREIRVREEALANNPDSPETAEDFERLLMGSPNASHIWIRYMAFRASLSQFEKARALAERALSTIVLTEELERVNIWVAYVNLESSFESATDGAEEDAARLRARAAAVFRVFDRACQRVTDVQDLHLQVAAALRLSQPEIANEVMRRALKAFHGSKEVWIAMGASQFASGKLDAGRHTLEKALLSLSKSEHVAVIMKFAQLEYKYGSSERGRTVFESLVGNFPKRLDLWSVYLDMETQRYRAAAKAGEGKEEERDLALGSVRRLFERSISLDLSTKKTKFVFKRWLAFEVEVGDKIAATNVRAKARAYVETKLVPVADA
jgi:rRNA biogenesis protein RRP5